MKIWSLIYFQNYFHKKMVEWERGNIIKIMAENFPDVIKDINLQFQEEQLTQNKIE